MVLNSVIGYFLHTTFEVASELLQSRTIRLGKASYVSEISMETSDDDYEGHPLVEKE